MHSLYIIHLICYHSQLPTNIMKEGTFICIQLIRSLSPHLPKDAVLGIRGGFLSLSV